MLLILTEKPSAAKNFAAAFGGMQGVFHEQPYIIFSLRGHVIKLKQNPKEQVDQQYTEQFESWDLQYLPWDWTKIAFARQTTQPEILKGLRDNLSQISEVVIATDNDPSGEGELLAWEALEWCGWTGQTTRMFFVDETKNSLQKAFDTRKQIESMAADGDYQKAWTRCRFDYLSMQFSRMATYFARQKGYKKTIREGRLKSVMVLLVGDQQKAYESYKKKPYFEIRFKDENGVIYAQDKDHPGRVDSKDKLALTEYTNSQVIIDSRSVKHTAPAKLLNLAELSARLSTIGISAKQLLSTYQKMYEAHVVSYPRTEDKHVTPEQFAELLPLTNQIAQIAGIDITLLSHLEPRSEHVKEGGAHGANRPGPNVPSSLAELDQYGKGARDIYSLVARSWLACLAEDYEYEQVVAHLLDYPTFISTTHIPIKQGFKEIFDSVVDKDENLQTQSVGSLGKPYIHEGSNKRPQKPTIKWLVKRLEQYNVGTGATRTSTIADITSPGDLQLLTEKKGVLALAECGAISHVLLEGCDIANPKITETLFKNMEQVGKFELKDSEVLAGVAQIVVHDLKQMRINANKLDSCAVCAPEVIGICPRCGKDVIKSKSGNLYYCSSRTGHFDSVTQSWTQDNPGCGFKFVSRILNKTISSAQAKRLLAGKHIVYKDLIGQKGKPFSAQLSIDKESEWGTRLEFTTTKPKQKDKLL